MKWDEFRANITGDGRTIVRLHPAPKESADDDWRIQKIDDDKKTISLSRINNSDFIDLSIDHIDSFTRDTQRPSSVINYGILKLRVLLVKEGNNIKMELI